MSDDYNPTITIDDLRAAKPENVQRLARALGVPYEGRRHRDVCKAIMRWYRMNPPPARPEEEHDHAG